MIERKLTGAKPQIALPAGSIDTQLHMYLDGFPSLPGGPAAPEGSPGPAEYRQVMDWLGISRLVITQGNAHQRNNNNVVAALGVMVGVGLYQEAAILYGMVGIVVALDYYFERHGFGNYSKTVALTVDSLKRVRAIEESLPLHKTFSYSFNNITKQYTVTFLLSGSKRSVSHTLNQLVAQEGVLTVTVE